MLGRGPSSSASARARARRSSRLAPAATRIASTPRESSRPLRSSPSRDQLFSMPASRTAGSACYPVRDPVECRGEGGVVAGVRPHLTDEVTRDSARKLSAAGPARDHPWMAQRGVWHSVRQPANWQPLLPLLDRLKRPRYIAPMSLPDNRKAIFLNPVRLNPDRRRSVRSRTKVRRRSARGEGGPVLCSLP